MILEIEGLDKSFGGLMAVNGVSLDVKEKEIHAIVGPNGAGKSTFFNLISGYHKPDCGKVLFKGEDIAGMPSYKVCQKGISRSFQIINIYPKLTTFENVQVALISRMRKSLNFFSPARTMFREEADNILQTVGLYEQANMPADALSHGDKKCLELAIALTNKPELLLLDEPTAGMSPEETASTVRLVERFCLEQGMTILFTEHDMSVVFSIARRITVLHQGKVIADGKPEDVRNDKQVQKVYLGEDQA